MHKTISNLIEIEKEINSKNVDYKSKVKIIAISKTFSIDQSMHLIGGTIGIAFPLFLVTNLFLEPLYQTNIIDRDLGG